MRLELPDAARACLSIFTIGLRGTRGLKNYTVWSSILLYGLRGGSKLLIALIWPIPLGDRATLLCMLTWELLLRRVFLPPGYGDCSLHSLCRRRLREGDFSLIGESDLSLIREGGVILDAHECDGLSVLLVLCLESALDL